MKRRTILRAGAAALALSLSAGFASAQDAVKIGLILPMTGPFASTGRQIEAAAKLYMQQNGETVAGKKIQLIVEVVIITESIQRTRSHTQSVELLDQRVDDLKRPFHVVSHKCSRNFQQCLHLILVLCLH